jgi:hypothetical protein
MEDKKMDDQSLNGEELRKMYPNSDFLPEEYDPLIVGVNEETMVENKTTLDVLIEKSDVELKEFVKTLSSEELIKSIDDINNHISDYEFLLRHLVNIRSICKKKDENKKKPNEIIEEKIMIEKLKNELLVNPDWDIYYDDDDYFIKDMYGESFPINVELREMFPNSYFHSPECDEEIIGYDHKTGSIIYNLWRVGKMEMRVSEGIESDFHDTGYGIGRLLSSFKKYGFGDKVPPTHILPTNFIHYHSDLQGSIYNWGYYDISLINDIGLKEHQRLDLKQSIESKQNFFEKYGHKWTEDVINSHHKEMERLKKEFQEFDEKWDNPVQNNHHQDTPVEENSDLPF